MSVFDIFHTSAVQGVKLFRALSMETIAAKELVSHSQLSVVG